MTTGEYSKYVSKNHGILKLKLHACLGEDDLTALNKLSEADGQLTRDEIFEILKDTSFSGSKWHLNPQNNRVKYLLRKVYQFRYDKDFNLIPFKCRVDEKISEAMGTTDEWAEKSFELKYYELAVTFDDCDFVDCKTLGKDLVDAFRDYVDMRQYKGVEGGLVGVVWGDKANDSLSLHINQEEVDKVSAERHFLCNGCKSISSLNPFCGRYSECLRAYNIGKSESNMQQVH